MKTISPYLITKLYTWTVKDLNLIYERCFRYDYEIKFEDGPSSTYAMMLAVLIDTWGSILRDRFGVTGQTNDNVKHVLQLLYQRSPKNYAIYDTSQNVIKNKVVELFRHNLIHDFGKKPKYDLNIDTKGQSINLQDNGRWHINCKKMKNDFLNLIRIELPKLLAKGTGTLVD